MNLTDIQREIESIVRERVEAGQATFQEWVVEAVLARHPGIEGIDAEWYSVAARGHVQAAANRAVRQYRGLTEETDVQLVLTGFERIQRAYSIERNGQPAVVPIELCTNEELLEKAAEQLGMAKGLQRHARELRAYVAARIRMERRRKRGA